MTVFDRWPVDLVEITQDWAERNTWENPPWHKGIDLSGTTATAIKAPCDGFIVHASFAPFAFGNTWEQIPNSTNSGGCIILQPPAPHTAFQTSFSHLSKILVVPGQWVRSGQIIGYMGTTGNSTGVHLHWECFIDYSEGAYPPGTFYGRVDPKEFFKTVTIVPVVNTGGKGSPALEDPEMAQADIDRIEQELRNIKSILASPGGYTWGDQHHPSIAAEIRATPRRTWNVSLPLSTGGDTKPETKVKYEAQLFSEAEAQRGDIAERVGKLEDGQAEILALLRQLAPIEIKGTTNAD